MNITRPLTFVLLPLVLASCVSIPQTPEEFRATGAGVLDFTVDTPLAVSYALVSSNTIRCHQGDTSQMSMIGSSFIVFPTGQTRIEGVVDASGKLASIHVRYFNPAASGLLQVIDLEAESSSRTRVIVHRLNDTKKWKTATDAVKEWFEGSTECWTM